MNLHHSLRVLVGLWLACLCGTALAAPDPIEVTRDSPIPARFQYWEDPTAEAGLEHIRALPDEHWQQVAEGSTTFGITDSAYWLRFAVHNPSQEHLNLIAELGYSQLDDVVFYVFAGGKPLRELRTGDARPFYPRDLDHPNMLLRLPLAPDERNTVYVRVQTAGSMILPLHLWREHTFFETAANEQKLHFFYYGALTVIILINLAVFLTLREKLYLFYALAIFGYLLFFLSIKGFGFQHFYPQAPALHARALLVSMPILALFSVLFCREFLRVKSHSPRLDKALIAMGAFEVFNFAAALILGYNAAILLSAFSALIFFSLLMVAGPITWAAGVRAGAFFTLAWTPLTVGVFATAGRSLGFLPVNFWTEYAMQIGSGLEAFILTLALADRLYREREQKIRAQADSLREAQARSEARDQLTEALTHDPVTGLPNRNRFEWMVDQQLRKNPGGRYMVGVARITRLDEVNRTLGLSRSERLLKRTADQMEQLAGRLPIVQSIVDDHGRVERVYQLSGDTFGLLIDADKAGGNFGALDQALKVLAEPVPLDQLAIDLHPRFGAASYPEHGDSAALLIRNAHVGMEITPHGQHETGLYSRKYDIYSESRLTLMADLREALRKNRTQIFYQPKEHLASGRIVGVEALIRWRHRELGWINPAEFITLAEETGVISQLTEWMITHATQDLATLRTQYPDLTLSLNISARDLSSHALREVFRTALERHALEPRAVTIELTETAAMEDPVEGLRALEALAATGLIISIDDFGSGYSSLSYLKQLPATELKLDRSLVHDVTTSESADVIVATSIQMAKSLGYQVVGEGVEDATTARRLHAMGCDLLQGYWLCSPKPLPELQQWLATRAGIASPN